MNYKIINGKLLVREKDGYKIKEEDLYIKEGRIEKIGKESADADTYMPVDAKGRLIMPGLINAHTHVYMTILRNYADDVDFSEWLFNRVSPVEDRLPVEAAYWTNLLGFAEMFRSGTQTMQV